MLEIEKFAHRVLQHAEPWADMKPVDKRCANKPPEDATARNTRRCCELRATDLMDLPLPRATRRSRHILEAMGGTRKGHAFFTRTMMGAIEALHGCPHVKGHDAQGKGKGTAAWQRIHYNLLNVGL